MVLLAKYTGANDFVLIVKVDKYIYTKTAEVMNASERFLSDNFEVGEFGHASPSLVGNGIEQRYEKSVTLTKKLMVQK